MSGIAWQLKLRVSLKAIWSVFGRPGYLGLALAAALGVMGILLWIFNLNLLSFIFTSPNLSLTEKMLFFFRGYQGILTNFESLPALSILVISLLAGINTALLAYVARQTSKLTLTAGKGAVAVTAGIIGAGCAVCGTGILGPLLGSLGASASLGLAGAIGLGANFLAIGLLLYSVFGLGGQAANLRARTNE